MNKELIIIRGIPGCGKTDLAEYLHSLHISSGIASIICCADDYFMDNGVYNFNINKLSHAHKYCKDLVETSMECDVECVILSNTSTTEKEMKPYLKMAELYGYKIRSLIVENRHGNSSVHDVPDETINKMRNRFSVKL